MIHATDELFVRAPQRVVAEALLHVHDESSWWPAAKVAGGYGWVSLDAPTGAQGRRIAWKASIADAREWEGFRWEFESGPIQGTGEFWLEAYRDGTIVHHFLRADRVHGRPTAVVRDYRWALRIGLNGLKDELERRARV